MPTINVEIRNRWTGNVQFTASIECAEDAPLGAKIGLAVKWARASDADLRDADLRGAGAIFAGVDSRGYEFYLTADPAARKIVIRAGCRRWSSFADARAHFGPMYASNGVVPEIVAKLDLLEAVARSRGYLPAETVEA